MIVFVNDKMEVHGVGTTDDKSLTPVFVDETKKQVGDFQSWSAAKMCCYKITVVDGMVTMYTPYVDSKSISHFDQLGKQVDAITPFEATEKASKGETEVTFVGVPEGVSITTVVRDLEKHVITHHVSRSEDIVKVFFEPLEYAADIYLTVN